MSGGGENPGHSGRGAVNEIEALRLELAGLKEYAAEKSNQHIAMLRENQELRQAMEPFAKLAMIFDNPGGNRPSEDDAPIASWADHRVNNGEDIGFTVGDLRRARALTMSDINREQLDRPRIKPADRSEAE